MAHTSLIANPIYRRWLATDTAGAVALSIQPLFITLIGYALSHSTLFSGTLTTASMLVKLFAGLVGGTLIDRHNRRRLWLINTGIQGCLWLALGAMTLCGGLTSGLLAAVVLCSSLISGLLGGATDAMLRAVCPGAAYVRAKSANEGRDAAISLIGSPVTGALFGITEAGPPAAAAISYAVACGAALLLPKRCGSTGTAPAEQIGSVGRGGQPAGAGSTCGRPTFWSDFRAGWRLVLQDASTLRLVAGISLFNLAFGMLQYAVQLWLMRCGVSAGDIGLVDGATGGAVIVGAVLATSCVDRLSAARIVAAVPLAFSLAAGIALVGDNGSPLALGASCVIAALPFPMASALLQSRLFAHTPLHMQGRMRSVLNAGVQSLSSCSALFVSILLATGTIGVAVVCTLVLTCIGANLLRGVLEDPAAGSASMR